MKSKDLWIRVALMAIAIVVGALNGAILGHLALGIAAGAGLGLIMTLPRVSYVAPMDEFYLLKRFGPRAAKVWMMIAVPWVYVFLVIFGLGTAYFAYKVGNLAVSLFLVAVTLLALSIWTRVVLQRIRVLRNALKA